MVFCRSFILYALPAVGAADTLTAFTGTSASMQVNEGCCQLISRRWRDHGSSLESGVGASHRLRALVSVLRREPWSARLPRVGQRIHEGCGFLPRRRLP